MDRFRYLHRKFYHMHPRISMFAINAACTAYYSRAVLSRRQETKSAVSTRPEERAGRRHNSPIGRFLIKLGSVRIVATLIHASCHRTLVCLAKRSILRTVKRRLRNALDVEQIVERAAIFTIRQWIMRNNDGDERNKVRINKKYYVDILKLLRLRRKSFLNLINDVVYFIRLYFSVALRCCRIFSMDPVKTPCL